MNQNLLTMIDSIESPSTTGHPIPAAILNADAIAGYIAGNGWPTFRPYLAARPDLAKTGRVLSISLTAYQAARCYDFESGGIPNGAVGIALSKADRTLGKPWLYTSAANSAALISTAVRLGHPRSSYFLWSAHYGYGRHICGPRTCGFPQADGTQYADQIPENCDGSLIPTYMFPSPVPILEEVDPMAIAVAQNRDGALECFVEAQPTMPGKAGQVYHIKQDSTMLGWWQKPDGSPNWLTLGTPGS